MLYLDEIQEQLLEAHGVDVSIATLSHTLRHLDTTHKTISKTALEYDELVRAIWQVAYGDILMDYFVWLDKSSVNDRTNQLTEGWAPCGHACVKWVTFIHSQRYSLLPALSIDGIIALDILLSQRSLYFLPENTAGMLYSLYSDRIDTAVIFHE